MVEFLTASSCLISLACLIKFYHICCEVDLIILGLVLSGKVIFLLLETLQTVTFQTKEDRFNFHSVAVWNVRGRNSVLPVVCDLKEPALPQIGCSWSCGTWSSICMRPLEGGGGAVWQCTPSWTKSHRDISILAKNLLVNLHNSRIIWFIVTKSWV